MVLNILLEGSVIPLSEGGWCHYQGTITKLTSFLCSVCFVSHLFVF